MSASDEKVWQPTAVQKSLLYLSEVLKVPVQDLFPPRPPGNRIYDFMEKLETTRF